MQSLPEWLDPNPFPPKLCSIALFDIQLEAHIMTFALQPLLAGLPFSVTLPTPII